MKKTTLMVLVLMLVITFAACVDYTVLEQANEPMETPEPTATPEPMVSLYEYELLKVDKEAVDEKINSMLADELETDQIKLDLLQESAKLSEALAQTELAVYRSVVSDDGLSAFFGVITSAEFLEEGILVLEVDVVEPENEKFDTSLYSREQIEQLNQNLSFKPADMITQNIAIANETILRFNGVSYTSLEYSFYEYLKSEMASAKALFDHNDDEDKTLQSGPVFIFLTIDNTAVMVLEK